MSTDLIYPNTAYRLTAAEGAKLVFGAIRPGWSDLVSPGDVIVGGRNFGIGSARPAPALLKELGISGCVAESMGAAFYRNCINFALPALICPGVASIVDEGEVVRLDLRTGLVENRSTGATRQGSPLADEVLEIVLSGGLLQSLVRQGLVDNQPL